MNCKEPATKQLLIDTAKALLKETDDVENITVRKIAKRANVGLGLINYYFQSKDHLLSIAIGDTMAGIISAFSTSGRYAELPPLARLKTMLMELYALSDRKEKLMRFVLSNDLLHGNLQTPLHLVPLLKQVFTNPKDDRELRILALQLLYPIQVTGLNREAFFRYSGIDVSDLAQRKQFIESLVHNVLGNEEQGV